MRNFFYDKYDEAYSLDTVRKSPLNNDELKEALPFQEDRMEYLRLFKELYQEALLFQSSPNLYLAHQQTYPNELKKKYRELLDFCLLKNLFDYDTYKDLGGNKKEWDKDYFPLLYLTAKVFRYYEFKGAYIIETLDEYRLKVEEYLAELDNWYLDFRYNISECFRIENDEHIFRLYRYDDNQNKLIECNFDEVKALFIQIKKDLDECERAIDEMANLKPDETDKEFWDKYYKWFERRKELDFECEKLEDCRCTVEDRLKDFPEYDESSDVDGECIIVPKFEHNTILYIYFGDIKCHRDKHLLIPSTAIVSGRNGSNIELNVEYCKECDKYLLRYQSFEEYRNKYGLIIGNFREVYNDNFNGDFDLALESPLRLSGYTVSQKESLSQKERHYILATIVHNGIMSKSEVIRYLNYFIKMQGAKTGNEIALSKWKEDLMFVQEYNKSIQPKVYITEIKKY